MCVVDRHFELPARAEDRPGDLVAAVPDLVEDLLRALG